MLMGLIDKKEETNSKTNSKTNNKQYHVLDTNVLMFNPDVIDEYENPAILIVTIEELDHLKCKEGERGYRARRAIRKIESKSCGSKNYGSKNHESKNYESKTDIYIEPNNDYNLSEFPNGWQTTPDNEIIVFAKRIGGKLITSDLNMLVKAKSLGLDVEKYAADSDGASYKGYVEIEIDTTQEEDNRLLSSFYESPEQNKFDVCVNGYVILKDISKPKYYDIGHIKADQYCENGNIKECNVKGYTTIDILRWDGSKFVELKYPPRKVINPLNDLQRCAVDLINNDDIPIKIIAGTYGSGKTMLSTAIGAYKVLEKSLYEKLVLVRNNDSSSGKDPGALPGELENKVGMLFQTMIQHLPGKDQTADNMRRFGQLEEYITYFIKGLSISGFMIVDEAEDLTLKEIKRIGSRIEKGCIVFCGDWKQAEGRYQSDNGLSYLIDNTKDNPLVGACVLDIDVRSDASKVFADL